MNTFFKGILLTLIFQFCPLHTMDGYQYTITLENQTGDSIYFCRTTRNVSSQQSWTLPSQSMASISFSPAYNHYCYILELPNAVPSLITFSIGYAEKIRFKSKIIVEETAEGYFIRNQTGNHTQTLGFLHKQNIPVFVMPHYDDPHHGILITNLLTECIILKHDEYNTTKQKQRRTKQYLYPQETGELCTLLATSMKIPSASQTIVFNKPLQSEHLFVQESPNDGFINIIDAHAAVVASVFMKNMMLNIDEGKLVPYVRNKK